MQTKGAEKQVILVNILKPHPRNNYFFDDITGESWKRFLNSVKTSGVIEPIVVTQDNIIVSGHQRVRACNELGIKEVECKVRYYDSEDEILKQLIETNIEQRGIGNPNPVKFGRCILELERIYGIRNGNNQHTERVPQVAEGSTITQADLAAKIGISVDSLNRYKQLTTAIPEIQQLLQDKVISPSAVRAIVKRLSNEEQEKLAADLAGKEKVNQREIDFYINRAKQLAAENEKLRSRKPTRDNSADEKLQSQISELIRTNSSLQSELRSRDVELAGLKDEVALLKKTYYPESIKTANSAFEFKQKTDAFIETVLSPFCYSNLISDNQNNECGEYIETSLNNLYNATIDLLKRFKTQDAIIY